MTQTSDRKSARYSADRELELCRREYNEAGRRVNEFRASLDSAVEELVQAAVRFGQAEEAARHGGYGPGRSA